MSRYLTHAATSFWNLLHLPLRNAAENPSDPDLNHSNPDPNHSEADDAFVTPQATAGKKRKSLTPLTGQSSSPRKRSRTRDSQGNEIIRSIEFDDPNVLANLPEESLDDSLDMTDNEDDVKVDENYELPSPAVIRQERARRQRQADALKAAGWSNEDYVLYRRLTMRGLEPLLPKHWEMDFQALPEALFTENDRLAIINSLGLDGKVTGADYRATRALDAMLDLGIRIRIRLTSGSGNSTETLIKNAMDKYIRWSLGDAGIWKKRPYLPVLSIVTGSKRVSAERLKASMTEALEQLREEWRAAQVPAASASAYIPPLYGVIVSHTVLAYVSLLPETQDKDKQSGGEGEDREDSDATVDSREKRQGANNSKLRTIALFDFSKADHDVWNVFAVAILIVHCRDVLLKTLDRHFPHGLEGVELDLGTDPDV